MPGKVPYYNPIRREPEPDKPRFDRLYEKQSGRVDDKRFYKTPEWRALRLKILRKHFYLCVDCHKNGRVEPASDVHHIVDRKEAPKRSLDPTNLEPLCKACHNQKRADGQEDTADGRTEGEGGEGDTHR